MTYPWETPQTAVEPHSATAPAFTRAVVLSAIVAFFLGSYFPWQPYDFSKFGDEQSEVVSIEKGSWVLVVEETEKRPNFPWIATIQSDAAFWDGIKASGIFWQFYDIESDSVAAYRPDALAAGLPALLVISPAGRVRLAKSCPPTTAAISEALGGIR